jgi:predicted RNA binding protein YcfA (HicA-like mRNA interferase family)
MHKEITFADLEKLLSKLGFSRCQTGGSQQVFQYPPLGTLIVLPNYEEQETIRPIHLVAVQRTLIENDLISSAVFDGFLEKVPF